MSIVNSLVDNDGAVPFVALYPTPAVLLFGYPSKDHSEEEILAGHPRAVRVFFSGKEPREKFSLVCSTCWFPWCTYLCHSPFHASNVTSCRWIWEGLGSSSTWYYIPYRYTRHSLGSRTTVKSGKIIRR